MTSSNALPLWLMLVVILTMPVFALVRATVAPGLERFLQSGGRKIDAWYANLAVVEVAFDDEADAFANINTRDELARHEHARAHPHTRHR